MNKQFTGIWIPAHVWQSRELTMQEKFFVAEIEALSIDRSCFASNEYLADFFQLSIPRVKSVLSALEKKGWIIRNTRQTSAGKARSMYVNRSKYYLETHHPRIESNTTQGSDPIPPKDQIQSIYNKEDNKEDNLKSIGSSGDKPPAIDSEFEQAWSAYPKRAGSNPKNKALSAWKARRKEGVPASAMIQGAKNYAAHCQASGKIHTEFVMQAARFFGTGREWETVWTMTAPEKQTHHALPSSYEGSQTPDDQIGDFFK